jgi:hypothetical protein
MPSLIGNKPNQVPTNGDLGTAAFLDATTLTTQRTFTNVSSPSTGWTGTGPYTNVITVAGLLASDFPIVDIDLSAVLFADVEAVQADWGLVYRVVAFDDDELTLYATAEPTEDFTLTVKVVR